MKKHKNARGQSAILDDFYTHPDIARNLIQVTERVLERRMESWTVIIEPSAGDGSFFNQLPEHNRMGFDICPKAPEIEKADFLSLDFSGLGVEPDILFIGNPPFGRKGSTARKFVFKAFQISNVVAFIVPVSFTKMTIPNQIVKYDPFIHLVHTEKLPSDSFLYLGEPYDVPTLFQIWVRNPDLGCRKVIEVRRSHPDFEFVVPTPEDIDMGRVFMIQRVGQRTGKITEAKGPSEKSYMKSHMSRNRNFLFIRSFNDQVLPRFRAANFEACQERLSAMESFSQHEIYEIYDRTPP